MGRSREIEVIARGVLLDGAGRLLLCRNVKRNYYYLPGGHVEFGEPAEAALAREFQEETGLAVRSTGLLAATENAFGKGDSRVHEVNLVFRVEHLSGKTVTKPPEFVPSREPKIAFEWTAPARVPEDLRPAAIRAWIQGCPSWDRTTWMTEIETR